MKYTVSNITSELITPSGPIMSLYLYFTVASAHISSCMKQWIKKKKDNQSVSQFCKPHMLTYSSFLMHTTLECLPAAIFHTYHTCIDKQDIELNNNKLTSERRKCWKSHVKLMWWYSSIRSIVESILLSLLWTK